MRRVLTPRAAASRPEQIRMGLGAAFAQAGTERFSSSRSSRHAKARKDRTIVRCGRASARRSRVICASSARAGLPERAEKTVERSVGKPDTVLSRGVGGGKSALDPVVSEPDRSCTGAAATTGSVTAAGPCPDRRAVTDSLFKKPLGDVFYATCVKDDE